MFFALRRNDSKRQLFEGTALEPAPAHVFAPNQVVHPVEVAPVEIAGVVAFAHFFGIGIEDGPTIVELYRKSFHPSAYLSEPKVNITVHVLCAETEEEARRLSSSRDLARLESLIGRARGIPTVEEASDYNYQRNEGAFIGQFRRGCIDGDPQQVKEGLEAISESFQTPDLGIVTICYELADRVRSYELVAEACGLSQA